MYVTKNFRVEYEPDSLDSDIDESEYLPKEKQTIARGEEEEKQSVGKVFEDATTKLDD
jgi:hypothetical protein